MSSLDFHQKPAGLTNEQAVGQVVSNQSLWRPLLVFASTILWLLALACYLFQPDLLAAVVLVPPWCWMVAGGLLALLGLGRTNWRWSLLAFALWFLFAFVFVDESHSVIRSAWRAVSPNPSSDLSFERAIKVRVVTLNCGGNSRAAEEVALHDPDIVLLQESPSRDGVRKLTQKLFGANGRFIHEGDTAILTAGKVERRTPDGQNEFAHGRVQLALGPPIDVVSLRLSPPVSRLDFWSRGFWTEHHDCRAEHRSEINRLVKHLRQAVPKGPLILGGDFNTTPNDLILVRLKARLFDTFAASGQGWGNTGTNDYPLFRVDQIWASRDFAATVSAAHASEHSDHRMVVSEIQLRGSVAADRAMTRNDSN